MSWFFSKKKHYKSSSDSLVEENTASSQNDEFIFLEDQGNSLPPPTTSGIGNGSGLPSSNLYPDISKMSLYPSNITTDLSKQNPQTDLHNYLYGIPFKLCKQLEISTNSDNDTERLKIDEILSFITKMENDDFKYDFNLERSIVNEMNSRNE